VDFYTCANSWLCRSSEILRTRPRWCKWL